MRPNTENTTLRIEFRVGIRRHLDRSYKSKYADHMAGQKKTAGSSVRHYGETRVNGASMHPQIAHSRVLRNIFKHESKDVKRAGLDDQERPREGVEINASFPALCPVRENNPENLILVDIYSTIQWEEQR